MATATTKKTLVQALAEFQADLPEIGLDATNPAFKSKYATLGNITKKVLPALAKHGLAFSVGSFVDNGLLVVDAHLIHDSGESRSFQFPIVETNPQKVGGAITYARRYALSALTGIVADEDDDGNSASAPAPRALQNAQNRPAPKPKVKPNSGGSAQDAIREWIGTDEDRKAQANAVVTSLRDNKNLTGNELYEAASAELGV